MADKTSLPVKIEIGDLLEAGLHFGHQTKRWNPKMKHFIFGKRNGIYIIDLAKTLFHLKEALSFIHDTIAGGRSIVFVGTKKLSQDVIKEAATRCGQYYVIHRWLGGTLTNNENVKTSITHMRKIEALETSGAMATMPQKEASRLRSELARLQRNLGGIADMRGMPGALIVFDVNREAIAVREANRLNIPVVALLDTNCDPDPIAFPIPGNDDALRCVKLIVNIFADVILEAKVAYDLKAAEEIKKAQEEKKAKDEKREKEIKEAKAARKKAASPKKEEAEKKAEPEVKPEPAEASAE